MKRYIRTATSSLTGRNVSDGLMIQMLAMKYKDADDLDAVWDEVEEKYNQFVADDVVAEVEKAQSKASGSLVCASTSNIKKNLIKILRSYARDYPTRLDSIKLSDDGKQVKFNLDGKEEVHAITPSYYKDIIIHLSDALEGK